MISAPPLVGSSCSAPSIAEHARSQLQNEDHSGDNTDQLVVHDDTFDLVSCLSPRGAETARDRTVELSLRLVPGQMLFV